MAQHKQGDWDDLLYNQSVFNERSYSENNPDGYSDVVAEAMHENEQALDAKRKKAQKAARLQQDKLNMVKQDEQSKLRAQIESEQKQKSEIEAKNRAE